VTSLALAYDFGSSPERPPYDHRIVRLNIGLESTEDLIADLEQSLEALPKLT
jgi:cystathionine beta-lyase/cystathionine gamma-synthase